MSTTGYSSMPQHSGMPLRAAIADVEFVASPRLLDLLPRYQAYLIGESRRTQGIARYLFSMRRLIHWMGNDATMADLSAASARRYKEDLGTRCARGTVVNALATIRDFCRWAMAEGLRPDDATASIKRPHKRRPDPSPLYEDEIATLLRAMEPCRRPGSKLAWYERRNRLAVLLMLFTGLRISEAAKLTWSHVNLREGVLKVYDGKNGKDRVVPIHARLLEELTAIPGEKRQPGMPVVAKVGGQLLTSKSMAHIFERWLCNRLDALTNDPAFHIHAHRLRHTFASWLVWKDVDLRTVQELLGHAQLGTTEHYVRTDHRRKRAGVDRLPDFVGG